MDRLRILVADSDASVRDVLAELLTPQRGFELVAMVADGYEAVDEACRHRPDVALLATKMPGGGQQTARRIRAASPPTQVVAFSTYADRGAVVEMFRAGAVGYLTKGTATNREIVETLRRSAAGEVVLPPPVAAHVLDELRAKLEHRNVTSRDRQEVGSRVRAALASRRMGLVFQPIIDVRNRAVIGVEALARFPQEPRRGPDVWFDAARSAGLHVELELLAVDLALAELPRVPTRAHVALNVSPEVATNGALQAAVLAAAPARTVLEITEHAQIDDYDAFNRGLEPLRAAGVHLAVDDAGAGFASLRHILLLAPDLIKLDVSLIRDIHVDRARRAMARALITFASETGAEVVAEGIEDPAELAALRDLGVVYGQGYLLGRPGPLSVLEGSAADL
ncbi:MAG TPA: EAL domain-containing protein [Egibacteraceae bacterium]|nr:EAL domain-containing protein [Egibacteraceae bacterium]